mmetsp:Transcript_19560/g.48712  ORF Transcript_19560/g.48712 Transcript_19560/m.48712 type:complete len:162 (+) Transcript_19560:189-674(+)|eukprot:CAMPEP_0116096668 /NCGR_PEP_ID=MMETSP0327-20121206/10300_1 /TAXON_ID=44447 /ORGANISM="Pseudo-nitzschia delicatissima, Strain B596" /LENGTH=161 /DNA_ID=CAMNT_0003588379 /DNA_START=89 /DNA_END=574 /DNA_ORIENTATION=+
MIAQSIQSQHVSPFCSSNYKKSATIRNHAHQHHSKMVTRRRIRPSALNRALTKHENQRSFKYTRTLDIIPEEFNNNHNSIADESLNHSNDAVITTDFWHSKRSMKKSTTRVSLDSLSADMNGETRNDENQIPAPGQIHIKLGGPNVVFDDDYNNFLEDWEL